MTYSERIQKLDEDCGVFMQQMNLEDNDANRITLLQAIENCLLSGNVMSSQEQLHMAIAANINWNMRLYNGRFPQ